jgi:hypothetical protein
VIRVLNGEIELDKGCGNGISDTAGECHQAGSRRWGESRRLIDEIGLDGAVATGERADV